MSTVVFAEGSRDIMNGAFENYRAVKNKEPVETEISRWTLITDGPQTNVNFMGVKRQQKVKFYAYEGEVVLLGSSGTKRTDDIKITAPDGSITNLDVIATSGGVNGAGNISKRTEEIAGPRGVIFPDSDGNYTGSPVSTSGYMPIEYEVEQSGVYVVEFLAASTGGSGGSSVSVGATSTFADTNNHVQAWDVTVAKKGGPNYHAINGRVWADALVLQCLGGNYLYGHVYAVTRDGYIWNFSLNGMNPNTFAMYCNSRGGIGTGTNASAYHSVHSPISNYYGFNVYKMLKDVNGSPDGIQIMGPDNDVTDIDSPYHMFFNYPDMSIPESIVSSNAKAPGQITGLRYDGRTGGNTDSDDNFSGSDEKDNSPAYVGVGGFFEIRTNASSYEVVLDMSNMYAKYYHGQPGNDCTADKSMKGVICLSSKPEAGKKSNYNFIYYDKLRTTWYYIYSKDPSSNAQIEADEEMNVATINNHIAYAPIPAEDQADIVSAFTAACGGVANYSKLGIDFGEYKSLGKVLLGNAAVESTATIDRIKWNGCDQYGRVLPMGYYFGNTGRGTVTATAKAGEIHFPMGDAEAMVNGVAIWLENPQDWMGLSGKSEAEQTQMRSKLYYNNADKSRLRDYKVTAAQKVMPGSDGNDNSITGSSFTWANGNVSWFWNLPRDVTNSAAGESEANADKTDGKWITGNPVFEDFSIDGIASYEYDASKADQGNKKPTLKASVFANNGADHGIADIWSYAGKGESYQLDQPIEIYNLVSRKEVTGFVFLDTPEVKGGDGDYDKNTNDRELPQANVVASYGDMGLLEGRGMSGSPVTYTTKTNTNGYYSIPVDMRAFGTGGEVSKEVTLTITYNDPRVGTDSKGNPLIVTHMVTTVDGRTIEGSTKYTSTNNQHYGAEPNVSVQTVDLSSDGGTPDPNNPGFTELKEIYAENVGYVYDTPQPVRIENHWQPKALKDVTMTAKFKVVGVLESDAEEIYESVAKYFPEVNAGDYNVPSADGRKETDEAITEMINILYNDEYDEGTDYAREYIDKYGEAYKDSHPGEELDYGELSRLFAKAKTGILETRNRKVYESEEIEVDEAMGGNTIINYLPPFGFSLSGSGEVEKGDKIVYRVIQIKGGDYQTKITRSLLSIVTTGSETTDYDNWSFVNSLSPSSLTESIWYDKYQNGLFEEDETGILHAKVYIAKRNETTPLPSNGDAEDDSRYYDSFGIIKEEYVTNPEKITDDVTSEQLFEQVKKSQVFEITAGPDDSIPTDIKWNLTAGHYRVVVVLPNDVIYNTVSCTGASYTDAHGNVETQVKRARDLSGMGLGFEENDNPVLIQYIDVGPSKDQLVGAGYGFMGGLSIRKLISISEVAEGDPFGLIDKIEKEDFRFEIQFEDQPNGTLITAENLEQEKLKAGTEDINVGDCTVKVETFVLDIDTGTESSAAEDKTLVFRKREGYTENRWGAVFDLDSGERITIPNVDAGTKYWLWEYDNTNEKDAAPDSAQRNGSSTSYSDDNALSFMPKGYHLASTYGSNKYRTSNVPPTSRTVLVNYTNNYTPVSVEGFGGDGTSVPVEHDGYTNQSGKFDRTESTGENIDYGLNLKGKVVIKTKEGASGSAYLLKEGDEFRLLLEPVDNNKSPSFVQNGATDKAEGDEIGKDTMTVDFDDNTYAEFTSTGTYSYILREARPFYDDDINAIPGISYSMEQYRMDVEVIDKYQQLAIDKVTWYKQNGESWDEVGPEDIVFTNTYSPYELTVAFMGTKVLNTSVHADGYTTDNNELVSVGDVMPFSFTISPAGYRDRLSETDDYTEDENQPMPKTLDDPSKTGHDRSATVTNAPNGSIVFDGLEFTAEQAGENIDHARIYKYIIKENKDKDGENGITYDSDNTREVYVRVYKRMVVEDGATSQTQTVSVENCSQTGAAVSGTDNFTFTNSYQAKSEISLGSDGLGLELEKTVTGEGERGIKESDSYGFILESAGGAPLPDENTVVMKEVKSEFDKANEVVFDNSQKITFDQTGTYEYTLRELNPLKDTTDKVKNIAGIRYDDTVYTITVLVTNKNEAEREGETDYKGKLDAKITKITKMSASSGDVVEQTVYNGTPLEGDNKYGIQFTNVYTPGTADVTVMGRKVLSGEPSVLTGSNGTSVSLDGDFFDKFSFTLTAAGSVMKTKDTLEDRDFVEDESQPLPDGSDMVDAKPVSKTVKNSVVNDDVKDGSAVDFGKITFDMDDTSEGSQSTPMIYRYKITENEFSGDKLSDKVVYDNTEQYIYFKVYVQMQSDDDDYVVASPCDKDGNDVSGDLFTFTNKFDAARVDYHANGGQGVNAYVEGDIFYRSNEYYGKGESADLMALEAKAYPKPVEDVNPYGREHVRRDNAVLIGWSETQHKEVLKNSPETEGVELKTQINMDSWDAGSPKNKIVYAVWAEDMNNDGVPDYDQRYSITYRDNTYPYSYERRIAEGNDELVWNAAEAFNGALEPQNLEKANSLSFLADGGTYPDESVPSAKSALTKARYSYVEPNSSDFIKGKVVTASELRGTNLTLELESEVTIDPREIDSAQSDKNSLDGKRTYEAGKYMQIGWSVYSHGPAQSYTDAENWLISELNMDESADNIIIGGNWNCVPVWAPDLDENNLADYTQVFYDGNVPESDPDKIAEGTIPSDTKSYNRTHTEGGYEYESVNVLKAPQRDGYVFLGWSLNDKDGKGTNEDGELYQPGDVFVKSDSEDMLYAQWAKISYVDVYYDGDGVSDMPGKSDVVTSPALTVATKTPAHEGAVFVGWITAPSKPDKSECYYREVPPGETVFYQPGALYPDAVTGDITFYAVWAENTLYDASGRPDYYEVEYNSGAAGLDAGNMPADDHEYKTGDAVLIQESVPEWDKHVFTGWLRTNLYAKGDSTLYMYNSPYTSFSKTEQRDVLTAQWENDEAGGGADGTEPDGIPDRYQKQVVLEVENGTWQKGDEGFLSPDGRTYTVYVDLRDEGGNYSETGEGSFTVPESIPDEGYSEGAWLTSIPTGTVFDNSPVTYRFSYAPQEVGVSYKIPGVGGLPVMKEEPDLALYNDKIYVDPNGGMWMSYGLGQTITLRSDITLDDPTKSNAVFMGWEAEKVGAEESDYTDNGIVYRYKALWEDDNKGGDDGDTPDGIPDIYQKKITFKVDHGSWNEPASGRDDIVVVAELKDAEGNWSETGSAEITPPTATADKDYDFGCWIPDFFSPVSGTDDAEYTYTFYPDGSLFVLYDRYTPGRGVRGDAPSDRDLIELNNDIEIELADGHWNSGDSEPKTKDITENVTIPRPVREGFVFLGWRSEAQDPAVSGGAVFKYTAVWEADTTGGGDKGDQPDNIPDKYEKKVTFHIQEGGSWTGGSTEDQIFFVVLRNSDGTWDEKGSGTVAVPTGMSHENSALYPGPGHWVTSADSGFDSTPLEIVENSLGQASATVSGSQPAYHTFIFDEKKYTVDFNFSEGFYSNDSYPNLYDPVQLTPDSEFTIPGIEDGERVLPQRENYMFIGWRASVDNAKRYQPGDTYKVTSDVTFHAEWEADVNGDNILDKYQKRVKFTILNGTWDGVGDRADRLLWVTLTTDGEPFAYGDDTSRLSETGSAKLSSYDIPDVSLADPDEGYKKDGAGWLGSYQPEDVVITQASPGDTVFTYAFLREGDGHNVFFREYIPNGGRPRDSVQYTDDGAVIVVDPQGGEWTYNDNLYTTLSPAQLTVKDDITLPDPVWNDGEGSGYVFMGWKKITGGAEGVAYYYRAVWMTDNNNDSIPDRFQKTVMLRIENGYWGDANLGDIAKDSNCINVESETADWSKYSGMITEFVELFDDEGKWSANGKGYLPYVPTTMTALDESYAWGNWDRFSPVVEGTGTEAFTFIFHQAGTNTVSYSGYTTGNTKPNTVMDSVHIGDNIAVVPNGGTWRNPMGSDVISAEVVEISGDLSVMDPVREGYVFLGWRRFYTASGNYDRYNESYTNSEEDNTNCDVISVKYEPRDGVTVRYVYKAMWQRDIVGHFIDHDNYTGDGVPDKYQRLFVLNIENGYWVNTDASSFGGSRYITPDKDSQWITFLRDGVYWSLDPSAEGYTYVDGEKLPDDRYLNTGKWTKNETGEDIASPPRRISPSEEYPYNEKIEYTFTYDFQGYTVQYDLNGGKRDEAAYPDENYYDEVIIWNGQSLTAKAAPVKTEEGDNYIFTGWLICTDPEKDGEFEETGRTIQPLESMTPDEETGDIKLVAQWATDNKGGGDDGEEPDMIPDIYQKKVIFSVVNGSWVDNTRTDIIKYAVLRDSDGNYDENGSMDMELPAGMKADSGYLLGRWESSDLTGVLPKDGGNTATVSSNKPEEVTFTYTFEFNSYEVSYDLMGGDGAEGETYSPENVSHGDRVTLKAAPYKAGSSFMGWKYEIDPNAIEVDSDNGNIYYPGDSKSIVSNAKFTAQWKESGSSDAKNGYVIEYWLEDLSSGEYKHDSSGDEHPEDFVGAYVTADFKAIDNYKPNPGMSSVSGVVDGGSNLVLRLYYDLNVYTVRFDANGGKAPEGLSSDRSYPDMSAKHGGNVILPVEPVENTGYHFRGWTYVPANGEGGYDRWRIDEYSEAVSPGTPSAEITEDCWYVALWDKNYRDLTVQVFDDFDNDGLYGGTGGILALEPDKVSLADSEGNEIRGRGAYSGGGVEFDDIAAGEYSLTVSVEGEYDAYDRYTGMAYPKGEEIGRGLPEAELGSDGVLRITHTFVVPDASYSGVVRYGVTRPYDLSYSMNGAPTTVMLDGGYVPDRDYAYNPDVSIPYPDGFDGLVSLADISDITGLTKDSDGDMSYDTYTDEAGVDHKFLGWSRDSAAEEPDVDVSMGMSGDEYMMPHEDVVLYAVWDIPFSDVMIHFDGNGGEWLDSDWPDTDGMSDHTEALERDTVVNLGSDEMYLPDAGELRRSNAVFLGWSLSKINQPAVDYDTVKDALISEMTMNSSRTVYAVWARDVGGKLAEDRNGSLTIHTSDGIPDFKQVFYDLNLPAGAAAEQASGSLETEPAEYDLYESGGDERWMAPFAKDSYHEEDLAAMTALPEDGELTDRVYVRSSALSVKNYVFMGWSLNDPSGNSSTTRYDGAGSETGNPYYFVKSAGVNDTLYAVWRSVDQAYVTVRLFDDADRDGTRDPEEKLIEGFMINSVYEVSGEPEEIGGYPVDDTESPGHISISSLEPDYYEFTLTINDTSAGERNENIIILSPSEAEGGYKGKPYYDANSGKVIDDIVTTYSGDKGRSVTVKYYAPEGAVGTLYIPVAEGHSVTYDKNGAPESVSMPEGYFGLFQDEKCTVKALNGDNGLSYEPENGFWYWNDPDTGVRNYFMGWSTDRHDTEAEYLPDSTLVIGEENVVLYAVWYTDTYRILYNVNGETAETDNGVIDVSVYPDFPDFRDRRYGFGETAALWMPVSPMINDDLVFVGWTNDPSEADKTVESIEEARQLLTNVTIPNENVSVYSVWAKDDDRDGKPDYADDRHLVKYHSNGGEPNPELPEEGIIFADYTNYCLPGENAELMDINESRKRVHMEGAVLAGWSTERHEDILRYTDADLFEKLSARNVLFDNEDIVVYALWAEDKNGNGTPDFEETLYTLVYDPNGGEGTAPDSVTDLLDGSIVEPLAECGDLAVDKAVFVGWSLNPHTGELPSDNAITDVLPDSYKVDPKDSDGSGTIRLYAVWAKDEFGGSDGSDGKPDYKQVKYEENADGDLVENMPYDDNEYEVGEKVTVPADRIPTRDGYVFSGWNLNSTGVIYDGRYYNNTFEKGSRTDILYAIWKRDSNKDGNPDENQWIVSYNLNGGTAQEGLDYTPRTVDDKAEVIVMPGPSYAGYAFDCWTDAEGNRYNNGDRVIVTKDIVFTALWDTDEKGGYDPDEPERDIPDTVPDKYQRQLIFVVENGVWADDGTTVKYMTVNLYGPDGTTYSEDGTGEYDIPVGVPEVGFEKGVWTSSHEPSGAEPDGTVTKDYPDVKVYTYTYASKGKPVIYYDKPSFDDDNEPDPDVVETEYGKSIIINPNGGMWTAPDEKVHTDPVTLEITDPETNITAPVRDGYMFMGWETKTGESDDIAWVFTALWESDAKGGYDPESPDRDTPDGIPDVYQKLVIFRIEHGVWSDGSSEPRKQWLTLEQEGVWSPEGTAKVDIPTGMSPNEGYFGGEWNEAPPEVIDNTFPSGTEYVYSFTPNAETADYKTEYYLQNTSGQYELYEEVTGNAIVGEKVKAYEKTYEGYNLNRSISVTEGVVHRNFPQGDGDLMLTLRLYYDLYGCTVRYDFDGGSPAVGVEYDRVVPTGTEITVAHEPEREPDRTDSIFMGWSAGAEIYQPGDTLIINENTLFRAYWEADENYDDIPDIFQKLVIFKVLNGTWQENGEDTYIQLAELFDELGMWSSEGSGYVTVPSGIPDYGYEGGGWIGASPDIISSGSALVTGNGTVEYTYGYGRTDNPNISYNRYENDLPPKGADMDVSYGAKVIVDPNGGIWRGSPSPVELIVEESCILEDPERDEYIFMGWTAEPGGNEETAWIFTAQWLADKYGNDPRGSDYPDNIPDIYQKKVTFRVVNGSWADGSKRDIDRYVTLTDSSGNWSVEGSGILNVPTGMTPDEGYENGSWDSVPPEVVSGRDGTAYTYTFDEIIKYTVSYELEGGTAVNNTDYSPETVRAGESITVKAAPYRSGYTFTGWSDGTNVYQPGNIITPDKDVTLTARWSSNSGGGGGGGGGGGSAARFTLRYASNGGTQYADETYARGKEVSLDKVPEKAGCDFTGWYADRELTERITSIIMNSNKTVYAGWSESGNGGIVQEPSEADKPVQPADVPTPADLNADDHFAYIAGYDDGTVRPTRDITRAEVAVIFYRLLNEDIRNESTVYTNDFRDVSADSWFNTAISTLTSLNIVYGRSETLFDPYAPITRAEFAAVCARFDSYKGEAGDVFTDIEGHWAEEDINRAAARNWVSGYGDGTFRPENNITRAEAVSLINRVLKRVPETKDDLLEGMTTFTDNADETAWYYLAIQEAANSHDYEFKDNDYEKWISLNDYSVQ